jgi:uncharacterized protein YdhG (YjbR/CyaY superfamily)
MKDTTGAVDRYINNFTGDARKRLEQMRELVLAEVPEAVESISYGLVGYKLDGKPLVYFGGFPKHTGFYATPNGHEAFKEEFAKYKQGKGSVQFPLDQPLPLDLIRRVVQYRKTTAIKYGK